MREATLSAPTADAAATAPRPLLAPRVVRVLGRSVLYGILVAGGVAMLFPFAWMVSTSLKLDLELFKAPPQLIPRPLVPENYGKVADLLPIWRIAINSIVVAAVATTLQVLTSAMAAYGFARLRFRGRDALFFVYLATLMVPFQVTIVPLFIEMRYLGLVDTYPGLILPGIVSAFGTFMLRQAFLGLPRDFEEAAFVDGASHWKVFTRIALPLVAPSLATFGIFAFMASWNSFLWPLVIISSEELMTLPLGLANLHGQYTTQWNLVMAGATISVVPILAVYLMAQKHIVRGVALSGIKG